MCYVWRRVDSVAGQSFGRLVYGDFSNVRSRNCWVSLHSGCCWPAHTIDRSLFCAFALHFISVRPLCH